MALFISSCSYGYDFTKYDHNSNKVSLKNIKNQLIVLEWLNPDCKANQDEYTNGQIKTTQTVYKENEYVRWITISTFSKAKKKMSLKDMHKNWGMNSDHLVFDEKKEIAKKFKVTHTPYIVILDQFHKVQYRGAPQNSNKNLITSALSKMLLRSRPNPKETEAYGCKI